MVQAEIGKKRKLQRWQYFNACIFMNDLNKSWVIPCFTDTTQQPLLLVVPARFFQYNPEYIFYAQLDAQYLYSLRIPSDFVLLGQKLKKAFLSEAHMFTLYK